MNFAEDNIRLVVSQHQQSAEIVARTQETRDGTAGGIWRLTAVYMEL